MKILFSALDWGLGHTTRSIPLIDAWLKQGHTVCISATEGQQQIYYQHFPQLKYIPSISTPIRFHGEKVQKLYWPVFLLKFIHQIKQEKKLALHYARKYQADVIASDNRYGFFSDKIESWLISHQLNLIHPYIQHKQISTMANRQLARWINRFSKIIVPDEPNGKFAGFLSSENVKIKVPIDYIGPQSRLALYDEVKIPLPDKPFVLFLISGPENQRSIFENLILTQTSSPCFNLPFVLVRGLPGQPDQHQMHRHNSLAPAALKYVIGKADYIICRSGYSTLMDLYMLNKKAFLVPTPGQTEQEYLAKHWNKNFEFPACEQSAFSVCKAIQQLKHVQ